MLDVRDEPEVLTTAAPTVRQRTARGSRLLTPAVLAGVLALSACAGSDPDGTEAQNTADPETDAEDGDTDQEQSPSEEETSEDSGAAEQTEDSDESTEDPDEPSESDGEGEADQAEAAELPGGGDTLFPDRRFIALYGSPGVPALGVLGHQDVDEAIVRIEEKAEDYQQFSEEPVQPAFEIITTVASLEPGPEGHYTNPIDPDTIRPWIEAAADADVYVVLDLQPGRTDFLSQAQLYEEFLAEPHVGLALDPEWRLTDDQVHNEQVGSVHAEEINEVSDWLAELTAEHDLPQKMLILHQFQHAMIQDREDIDTSHDELAITLHADGHGTPDLKFETWDHLLEDLDEDIWPAWKNFHEQDNPTFTPEETYDVEPHPWFVSYQ